MNAHKVNMPHFQAIITLDLISELTFTKVLTKRVLWRGHPGKSENRVQKL